MEARLPPDPKPDVHLFIVFDNNVSTIRFEEEDPDVYFLEDERLEDQERWTDSDYYEWFLEDISEAGKQGKRIIFLRYNPMVAQCVPLFFKYFEKEQRIRWHALSFFHSDEDTEYADFNWTDSILAKFYDIDSMNQFPWIRKIEVPLDETYYHRDLLRFVLSEEDFKELDNENEEPFARADPKDIRKIIKAPLLTWTVTNLRTEGK
jgi:hypothetical protein